MGVKRNERAWRTDVDEETLDAFASHIERIGLSQKLATERLMQFFNRQDPDVQALILQLLTPARSAELSRLILREMGRRK